MRSVACNGTSRNSIEYFWEGNMAGTCGMAEGILRYTCMAMYEVLITGVPGCLSLMKHWVLELRS